MITTPSGSTAVATTAAMPATTASAPVNSGQKLIDDGRAIVAKLRSGEKTPQTLTVEERQTLLKLEALRQQSRKRD